MFWASISGLKFDQKSISADIENDIVFEIDFLTLLGSVWGTKMEHIESNFVLYFRKFTHLADCANNLASKTQPGSLQDGSGGLQDRFWSIFD